jgi:hemerythrin-like domain-containing protein
MANTDAISLLKKDHARVKEMLSALAETTDRAAKKRETLLAEVVTEIQVHAGVEEEIFYPAYRDAIRSKEDEKLYFEALEEHAVVDLVIPELLDTDPRASEFAAKVKVLKDLIEHHAREEERDMFPRAKKALGAEKLEKLGLLIEGRKEELQASLAR